LGWFMLEDCKTSQLAITVIRWLENPGGEIVHPAGYITE
jgi:hypothetical protein